MKKIHPLYDVTTDEKNRCEEWRYITYYQEAYGLSCMIYIHTINFKFNWAFLNVPKGSFR